MLVAHSYGGLIGRLYASTYPGDVSGLVLETVTAPLSLQMSGKAYLPGLAGDGAGRRASEY